MDRYMIIHDMVGAGDVGSKYPPRIGIYDKTYYQKSSDTQFLQWITQHLSSYITNQQQTSSNIITSYQQWGYPE